MRNFIAITILFSSLFSQSIVGSWELTSPYTSEVDGKAHALIRHNYSSDGDFDSYIWHDGRFRLAGNGEYYIYKNRLSQTVNRETYVFHKQTNCGVCGLDAHVIVVRLFKN